MSALEGIFLKDLHLQETRCSALLSALHSECYDSSFINDISREIVELKIIAILTKTS